MMMKQLVVLSGKGGTGKTSLTAAFAHLASIQNLAVVLADADVDAPNLELVLRAEKKDHELFIGGSQAVIDPIKCQGCGTCAQVCRYDAVVLEGETKYLVDELACEGCASCMYQCPENAIRMVPQQAGSWYFSESPFGPFFHADLIPGRENSGKLVTTVKQAARKYASENQSSLMIVDGPPGIGCPVIAALAGADLAVIVTEPTMAGQHDLDRIYRTLVHFDLFGMVVINKADLYPQGAAEIERVCTEKGIPIAGVIPFDPTIPKAMALGDPVTVYQPNSPAASEMANIWEQVTTWLKQH
jgi:MinD superfamily P-loop ATPase